MRNEGTFTFGEAHSRDYRIILTKTPPHICAERDVESIGLAGRSGDLTRDNGRYKNVQIPYECAIIPERTRLLREAASDAILLLKSTAAYYRLANSFYPGTYRMARISKQVSVESVVEKAGKFTIEFDCKPQRFLVDGEFPVKFTAPGSLYNPTTEIAQPLITIRGSGSGRLTVGDITVEVKQLEDQITLDSDLQDAYRQVGDGAPENKNSCIYAPDFPVLVPGKNTISWTGGITSVEIIPRWWTL